MLDPQKGPVIEPVPSDLTAVYWDGCARGVLLFQRCDDCNATNFHPADRCRTCAGGRLQWAESAGHGTVTSWTMVWRPSVPSYTVPYAPIIVALDEGFHVVSLLVGCDHTDVKSGVRVGVKFHAHCNGVTLPYFRPTAAPIRTSR